MIFTEKEREVFDRFKFDIPPVGVKFLPRPPEGIDRIEEKLAFCEMLKKAQEGRVYFADAASHACDAGMYVLGQTEAPAPYISGEFGAGLKIFEEPRSASRLYHYIPRIRPGVVNCVALSPLNKLSFTPDVLVFQAKTNQTEILLRAMSYRTGQMWSSKYSAAIGCAWILVYPYLTGELNYVITGLGHGMRRRKLFPEGYQMVSIPFDLLPSLLQNLQDMPWTLPAFQPDGNEYVQQLVNNLGLAEPGKK